MSFASLERLGLICHVRETLALICRLIFIDIFLDDVSIIAPCYDARFFLQNPYARTKIISQ